MAGVNRKHGTNCTWCGDPIFGRASYVDIAKVVDGRWSRMTVHAEGDCRRVYVEVMQDNGYTIKPTAADGPVAHSGRTPMTVQPDDLTKESADLFRYLVADAPNWSGQPLVEVTPQERGNLTDLKRKGYVQTFLSDGQPFVAFTDRGIDLAVSLGFDFMEDYR